MSKEVVAINIRRKALLAGCLIAVAVQPSASFAQSSLPTQVPTPLVRPFAPAAAPSPASPMNLVTPTPRPTPPDPVITSSFSRVENPAAIGGTLEMPHLTIDVGAAAKRGLKNEAGRRLKGLLDSIGR